MALMKRPTAIDLYAGIGGWSLGLKLAGIEVLAAYEWWGAAARTHEANLGVPTITGDIRSLGKGAFPKTVDIVVGSPPCTEFSYSNRGGSGDLAEGLKDVAKFLWVVDQLKPRYWAMENVPRVAAVLPQAFADPSGPLYRYRKLAMDIRVLDFSDFGLPQARRRCIAGHFPWDLLEGYRAQLPERRLGDVVRGLATKSDIIDPNFGVTLSPEELTEMEREAALNAEELRMNREAKEFHPIYNNMAFPDRLAFPSRTITATCTRVSRESIVVAQPGKSGSYRRLTIRERASLQGFPITYQFYAKSFSDKAKMVGNAIPPLFTYLAASAMRDVKPAKLVLPDKLGTKFSLPKAKAPVTRPDGEGRTYPVGRRFRAAIPGLRFKSGVRFELANEIRDDKASWAVRFFYGASKDIRSIELDAQTLTKLRKSPALRKAIAGASGKLTRVTELMTDSTPDALQAAWAHRIEGLAAYDLVDALGAAAEAIHDQLAPSISEDMLQKLVAEIATSGRSAKADKAGLAKLHRHAARVVSGLVVGSWFNELEWHAPRKMAA
jgi:DNA (cytosine-5)-methyltransferase 1